MDSKEALKVAVFAGEIMLKNGAETHRVEDTMERILESSHFKTYDSFVTTTGIFACVEDETHGAITMIKRIKHRTIHLGKVAEVNNLSRNFVKGELSVSEAHAELITIDNGLPYQNTTKIIFSGITCFCFTYMFGGNLMASFNSLLIGFVLYMFIIFLNNKNVSGVLTNLVGGGIITLLAIVLLNLGLNTEIYIDKVIIGSLMPLVPGLGLTNAIRDVMYGDLLSGTGRIVDAILVAVSIASGVGIVMRFWFLAFGGFVL